MKKRIIRAAAIFLALVMVFSVTAFAAGAMPEKPFENSRFFTCGDYSIHYRVFEAEGAQKGRIMMLHGFLMSTYSWENMEKEMTKAGYTCVLADLPDFGYSTRENEATKVISREDLMVELMESMAPLNTWFVAGHSMGGGVAMNIAIEHAEIAGLLLYCPAPNTAIPAAIKPVVTSTALANAYTAYFKLASYSKLLVRLVIGYAAADFGFGLKYDAAKITDPLHIQGTGRGMAYVMANTKATDLGALSNLKMPILLVQGEKDYVLPKSMIKQVNAALPQAAQYVVKGGGHMCMENKAPEIASVTVNFLNKINYNISNTAF